LTASKSNWISGNRAQLSAFLCVSVLASGLQARYLSAQSVPEQSASFEVASIRPNRTTGERLSVEFTPGGGFRAKNITLKALIEVAYDLVPEQLSGGATWMDSDEYTVIAKAPDSDPVLPEDASHRRTLKRLRTLLGDRFHLVLNIKPNSAFGYVMTVAKNGHKMTLDDGSPGVGLIRQTGLSEIHAKGVHMSLLAMFLSARLGQSVVDQTGLAGGYTFQLDWGPEAPINGMTEPYLNDQTDDSIIPAVQEQLGLELRRQKSAADRYTIERAEKPSEN
jgi:uncharacterized protein (TIGR03435 family)